jgi:hypothetical protein
VISIKDVDILRINHESRTIEAITTLPCPLFFCCLAFLHQSIHLPPGVLAFSPIIISTASAAQLIYYKNVTNRQLAKSIDYALTS